MRLPHDAWSLCYRPPVPATSAGAMPLSSYADQWALAKIQAAAAWTISRPSGSITIAVVDTDVQLDHPDLRDRIVAGAGLPPVS